MQNSNAQPPLSTSSQSSRSTVVWFVIGLIVLCGIGYMAYQSHTSLPNATTTAGTNTTGINAADGSTAVTPVAPSSRQRAATPVPQAGVPSTDAIMKAATEQSEADQKAGTPTTSQ